MSTDEYPHMVWCQGTHDQNGECEIAVTFREHPCGFDVSMTGTPCDNTSIAFDGHIVAPDELTALREWLNTIAPLYAAGLEQVDGCGTTCGDLAHYDHSGDVDEDDTPCSGCGNADVSLIAVGDEWLCGTCCMDRGISYSHG